MSATTQQLKKFLCLRPSDADLDVFLSTVCKTADEYEELVKELRAAGRFKSITTLPMPAELLSAKDLEKYSLTRAIKSAIDGATYTRRVGDPGHFSPAMPGGFEAEVSKTLAAAFPQNAAKGFLVPFQCLKTLNATAAPAGGFLTPANVMEPLDVLRNRSVVAQAGAMLLENVKGTISFPRQKTEGTTGQWLSEIGAIQEGDAQWGALRLAPRRIGGIVKYSKELLIQSGGAVESWARREVLNAVSSGIDKGALSGTGMIQPTGLGSSPYVQTYTFAGAPTNAAAVEMERLVADANAPEEDICFLASPDVRAKWRNTLRAAGDSRPLWGDDNRVIGRPAYATKNAPGNRLICGAFSHYTVAIFGLIDVQVNPFSEDTTGTVRVVINAWADCGELYPSSFCVSTDDANQ